MPKPRPALQYLSGACAIALLALGAMPLAAQDVPAEGHVAWSQPARDLLPWFSAADHWRLAVDGERAREALLTSKPLSILRDERAVDAVAHWDEQIERWARWTDPGMEMALVIAREARGMIAGFGRDFNDASDESSRRGQEGGMAALDLGAGFDAVERLVRERLAPLDEDTDTMGLFVGNRDGNDFLGFDAPRLLLIEDRELLPDELGSNPAAVPTNPAWVVYDARPMLAAFDRALSEGEGDYIGRVLGDGWRAQRPQVLLIAEADEDELVMRTRIDGAGALSPLAVLAIVNDDVRWAGTAHLRLRTPRGMPALGDGIWGHCALGLDLGPVGSPARQQLQALVQAVGMPERDLPAALARHLGGDLLVQIHPSMGMPTASLVLSLIDGAGLNEMLAHAAQEMGGRTIDPPAGALAAWSLPSPTGVMQMVLAEERLVVAPPTFVADLLSGRDGEHEDQLALQLDLPAAANQYLALGLSLMPRTWRGVSWWQLTRAFDIGSRLAADPGADLPRHLQRTGIDPQRHLAVYDSQVDGRSTVVVVIRIGDGYHVLREQNRHSQSVFEGLSRQQVDAALEGAPHLLGATLDTLEPHPNGPLPRFEKAKALPPLPALLAHIPPYSLTWNAGDEQTIVDERGLPVVSWMLATAALVAENMNPRRIVRDYRDQLRAVQAWSDHATTLSALDQVAQASNEVWRNGSRRPSEVLATGVSAAAFAPFNDGQAPEPAALDQLGRWYGPGDAVWLPGFTAAGMERHARTWWALPLEDGLWALISQQEVMVHVGLPPPGREPAEPESQQEKQQEPADIDF